jgi:hypothetical protein
VCKQYSKNRVSADFPVGEALPQHHLTQRSSKTIEVSNTSSGWYLIPMQEMLQLALLRHPSKDSYVDGTVKASGIGVVSLTFTSNLSVMVLAKRGWLWVIYPGYSNMPTEYPRSSHYAGWSHL